MAEAFQGSDTPKTDGEKSTAGQDNLKLNNDWMSRPDIMAMGEFLDSEAISGEYAFYAPYVPAIKQEFNALFGIDPKITNSTLQSIESFLSTHKKLQQNQTDAGLREDSLNIRDQVKRWVKKEIIAKRNSVDSTPEYEAETDKMIETANGKMDAFYGWMFQSVPLRQSKQP